MHTYTKKTETKEQFPLQKQFWVQVCSISMQRPLEVSLLSVCTVSRPEVCSGLARLHSFICWGVFMQNKNSVLWKRLKLELSVFDLIEPLILSEVFHLLIIINLLQPIYVVCIRKQRVSVSCTHSNWNILI